MMKKQWAVILGLLIAGAAWGDVNVLVIGSSDSFSGTMEMGAVHQTAFSPNSIAD